MQLARLRVRKVPRVQPARLARLAMLALELALRVRKGTGARTALPGRLAYLASPDMAAPVAPRARLAATSGLVRRVQAALLLALLAPKVRNLLVQLAQPARRAQLAPLDIKVQLARRARLAQLGLCSGRTFGYRALRAQVSLGRCGITTVF